MNTTPHDPWAQAEWKYGTLTTGTKLEMRDQRSSQMTGSDKGSRRTPKGGAIPSSRQLTLPTVELHDDEEETDRRSCPPSWWWHAGMLTCQDSTLVVLASAFMSLRYAPPKRLIQLINADTGALSRWNRMHIN